jgi:protein gp37
LQCNVSNVGIKSDVNNSNVQNDIKELQNIKHSVEMLQCNVSNVGIKSDVNNSNVQNDIKELQNIKHSVKMLHCNVYNDGIKSNDIDYKINKSNSVEQNNNHQNFIEPSETLQCNVSTKMSQISPKKGSLAIIIRSYKSVVTKYAREIDVDFGWQTRFHDHIIRHENSFHLISNYIRNNPVNWEEDKFY